MAEKKPFMPFKREKLSANAVDHFVEKHNVSTDKLGFPYFTQDGKRLFFSPTDVYQKNDFAHFTYLLSQTFPFGADVIEFDLKYIAYLYDGVENKTPWSTDPKVLKQFTQILTRLRYAKMSNGKDGPVLCKNFRTKPIIHQENIPPVPGE